MTVHYTPSVPSARFVDFVRVLVRWRGSVWKLVLQELCIWLFAYAVLAVIYRLALTDTQKRNFEVLVIACNHVLNYIPVTFILGFYVSLVMGRWWYQYCNIGWIDSLALSTAAWIEGVDEKSRMMRRAIVRYMLLYQLLIYRNISIRVRKIYPTKDSLLEAGYITSLEAPFIEDTKFWLPVKWAFCLVRKARNDGLIHSDQGVSYMLDVIATFRGAVIKLWLADWVPVPLVYTQISLTCVRVFFITALIGKQYVDVQATNKRITPIDVYVPFLEILQFLCYIGWTKVAEVLVNPFGDDDTDFETYLIVKRNFAVAMKAADENIRWVPTLVRDIFWNERCPDMLYTVETASVEQHPHIGSAVTKLQNNRRLSRDPKMIKRISEVSFAPLGCNYFRLSQSKIIRPIIDNSYQFDLPNIPEETIGGVSSSRKLPRASPTELKAAVDGDDQFRRFSRIASKDSQLAAVEEMDELNGDSNDNSWSDAYLDRPATAPTNKIN